jgi:hypothetical protein
MTVEKYREERTKVHSNQELFNYEDVDIKSDGNHNGILLTDLLAFVTRLGIPKEKIYCSVDEVSWYTPPTKEEVDRKVEQDVQNLIRKREREKQYNLKAYLNLRDQFGELNEEEIEAILKE